MYVWGVAEFEVAKQPKGKWVRCLDCCPYTLIIKQVYTICQHFVLIEIIEKRTGNYNQYFNIPTTSNSIGFRTLYGYNFIYLALLSGISLMLCKAISFSSKVISFRASILFSLLIREGILSPIMLFLDLGTGCNMCNHGISHFDCLLFSDWSTYTFS